MKNVIHVLMVAILVTHLWAQERLYVVQSGDESLGQIDLNSGAVNAHVLPLGYLCNDILTRGSRLYVTNSGLNTVQEIDAASNTTLRDIPVTGGVNPYSMAFVNDDTLAVTNWVSDNIVLLRLSDGASVGSIAVGVAPEGILVHDDRVFVCLSRYHTGGYGPGVVMVYNRLTLAFVDSIQVGTNPQYAVVDDRNRLHVACTGDYASIAGQINVIDLSSLQTDSVLQIGGTPLNISFGGGIAFVTAGGFGNTGYVLRYRVDNLAILSDAAHPLLVGTGATDIEARADSTFYVSCMTANQVEHRGSNGQLITSYPMSTSPGQMALYASPNEVTPIPTHYELMEAYPNPFNEIIRLRLGAALQNASSVLIYNNLGEQVADILVPAGMREVSWNPRNVSGFHITSGTYYAVWGQEGRKSMQKLVYLK